MRLSEMNRPAEVAIQRLAYGRGALSLELAADLIAGGALTPVADEEAAVYGALQRPIGSRPLEEIAGPGDTVAILVNDITRKSRTDLLLPPIVETLAGAGVSEADMYIVFALGTHREHTEGERRRIVGEDLSRRLRLVDHRCDDEAELVTIGKTSRGNVVKINRLVYEADRVILTGEIIYHQIAGYSGGRKSLAPGVAGRETITCNHSLLLDPACRAGVLDGNPAHEDLMEACRLAAPDFLVNAVLNAEGRVVRVVAGHYEGAHREGCRTVDAMHRVELERGYDVVVASAGGFPLDIDLRQAHKGLENACRALRPGGSILYYAECSNGVGAGALAEFLERYENDSEIERALREKFVLGGHKAYWLARLGRLYDVWFVTGLEPELIGRCGFRHVAPDDHEGAWRELRRRAGPAARVAVVPNAGFTLPAQKEVN